MCLAACNRQIVTLNEYTKGWIGRNIEEKKRIDLQANAYDSWAKSIGWKGKEYELGNGNWVYVELDRKNCFIHWEVNQEGTIINYKLEGDGCRWQ
jgi:hypothetical protein